MGHFPQVYQQVTNAKTESLVFHVVLPLCHRQLSRPSLASPVGEMNGVETGDCTLWLVIVRRNHKEPKLLGLY